MTSFVYRIKTPNIVVHKFKELAVIYPNKIESEENI